MEASAQSPAVAPLLASGVEVEIGGTPILRGADLTLGQGELVAVVGPNGAGKSTLVRAVSGLQPASAGTVLWSGRDLAEMRGRDLARVRAFVPQRMPVPAGVSVREAVTIGRSSHLRPLRRLSAADREAIAAAIERAGVTRFAERALVTLSGRRAAAGPDRRRACPGDARADRRRAHLAARSRRHRRHRHPAAQPRRRRPRRAARRP